MLVPVKDDKARDCVGITNHAAHAIEDGVVQQFAKSVTNDWIHDNELIRAQQHSDSLLLVP